MVNKRDGLEKDLDIIFSSDSAVLIPKLQLTKYPKEALSQFIELLQKDYRLSKEDIDSILNKNAEDIPISIFNNNRLTAFEAVVKFLRENNALTFEAIGNQLKRAKSTIAVTYERAKGKLKKEFIIKSNDQYIPIRELQDRKFSILESISVFLKNNALSNNEIANLLNRDNRTIWTVINRANKKIKNEKKL